MVLLKNSTKHLKTEETNLYNGFPTYFKSPIALIPKLGKKKDTHTHTYKLMNSDTNILNKVLANQIQHV